MTLSSRFRGLAVWQARLLAFGLIALLIISILPQTGAPIARNFRPAAVEAHGDDIALYQAINARVSAGEDYYHAAASALRRGGYPLRPMMTFRLPTLAFVSSHLGAPAMLGLCWLLMAAILFAWWQRLENMFADKGWRTLATMLVAAGLAIAFQPKYLVMHELWAGMLLALSIGLYRSERWALAFMAAATALAIRELALPCILLMAAFALFERRWKEFAAWIALVIAFGIALWGHAEAVQGVVTDADPSSPGWLNLGGWQAFLRTYRLTSAFKSFPEWIGSAMVIIALIGWASHKSRLGVFCSLLFSGYALIFMILGRPENFYWGLLVAPSFLVGLAFLPQAFQDLALSLRTPRSLDMGTT